MLQVLQREGLFNVVCVVTRYFGGILLGAGDWCGLYQKARKSLWTAGKSMKRVWTAVYVPCPYPFYERVKLEAAAFGGILRKTDFGAEVELELLFPEGQVSAFLEKLTDLSSGTVEGMETGQEYRAFRWRLHKQKQKKRMSFSTRNEGITMTVREELEWQEHSD